MGLTGLVELIGSEPICRGQLRSKTCSQNRRTDPPPVIHIRMLPPNRLESKRGHLIQHPAKPAPMGIQAPCTLLGEYNSRGLGNEWRATCNNRRSS